MEDLNSLRDVLTPEEFDARLGAILKAQNEARRAQLETVKASAEKPQEKKSSRRKKE